MHPRLRLDVGWGDLLHGLLASLTARDPARRGVDVERVFASSAGRGAGDSAALVVLSARSGLDLYLRALALPAGSEVLVSGLTIPHMADILEAHGLRVLPFGFDPQTLLPDPRELARLGGARTRAVLYAHLFGQRADLGALAALAQREGWLLWEDCAQAYSGDGWRGHAHSDLALFSFGLIKTASAIRGGILRVRDAQVLGRMRALHESWPRQTRRDQARRVVRALGLAALSNPRIFAGFARVCARLGRDLDAVLHSATRGFPGRAFLEGLRRRPSAPLLALLERRLRRPEGSHAAARRRWGEALLAELGERVEVVGRAALERNHWVFGVGCDEPGQLVTRLRAAGFDGTACSSLVALEASAGGEAPEACRTLLERLVYVPIAPGATTSERGELVRILRAACSSRELRPSSRQVPVDQPPAG